MLAIPVATTSLVLADRSRAALANASRLAASPTQSVPYPSASISVTASRTAAAGCLSRAEVHIPIRPSSTLEL